MSFIRKYGIAIAAIYLACGMTLPFSQAQTRVFSNVMRLDTSDAFLGIQMDDVGANNMAKYKLNTERGVIVRSVVKGSPAEAAGIKADDVILEFGGFQVWSSLQLSHLVQETPVGRKVDLLISRDGKHMNLSANLEKREGDRADNLQEVLPREFFGPGSRSFQYRVPMEPEPFGGPSASDKPRLGVLIQPLTDQLGEFLGVPDKKGVLVSSVIEGSPSVGKLKSGDVIVSADGKDIQDPEDLTRLILDKSEGPVTLRVIRDKKEITVVVNLPAGEKKGYKL
jgi:serine protease Do